MEKDFLLVHILLKPVSGTTGKSFAKAKLQKDNQWKREINAQYLLTSNIASSEGYENSKETSAGPH